MNPNIQVENIYLGSNGKDHIYYYANVKCENVTHPITFKLEEVCENTYTHEIAATDAVEMRHDIEKCIMFSVPIPNKRLRNLFGNYVRMYLSYEIKDNGQVIKEGLINIGMKVDFKVSRSIFKGTKLSIMYVSLGVNGNGFSPRLIPGLEDYYIYSEQNVCEDDTYEGEEYYGDDEYND